MRCTTHGRCRASRDIEVLVCSTPARSDCRGWGDGTSEWMPPVASRDEGERSRSSATPPWRVYVH